jgi:hypothetical protein
MATNNFFRRLQVAGALILIGLASEVASLFWNSPISFFLFIIGGGFFMLAGIVIFLFALVSHPTPASTNSESNS